MEDCLRGRAIEDKGVFHFEVIADLCFTIMIQFFFQHAFLLFILFLALKPIAHDIKHTKSLVLPDRIYLNFLSS